MYDIWYMIYDVWCMIYDIWYMMYDIWYIIYNDMNTWYVNISYLTHYAQHIFISMDINGISMDTMVTWISRVAHWEGLAETKQPLQSRHQGLQKRCSFKAPVTPRGGMYHTWHTYIHIIYIYNIYIYTIWNILIYINIYIYTYLYMYMYTCGMYIYIMYT